MSDHPICRGQFQLHIHFYHWYVDIFCPVCNRPVHPNRTLLNVDISFVSCFVPNTFHVFMSRLAPCCLIYFSLSVFFSSLLPAPPRSLGLIPLTWLTEGPPTLIPIFFTISAFPEEKLTSLACTFIPL